MMKKILLGLMLCSQVVLFGVVRIPTFASDAEKNEYFQASFGEFDPRFRDNFCKYNPEFPGNDEFARDLRTRDIKPFWNSNFALRVLHFVITNDIEGLAEILMAHKEYARKKMSAHEYGIYFVNAVNASFGDGETALRAAVKAPSKRDLPETAVIPDRFLSELTPDQIADIWRTKLAMVELLIENEARPDGSVYPTDGKDRHWESHAPALHNAVVVGNIEVFKMLLTRTKHVNVFTMVGTRLKTARQVAEDLTIFGHDRTEIMNLIDKHVATHTEKVLVDDTYTDSDVEAA